MDRDVLWGQSQGSLEKMKKKLLPEVEDRNLFGQLSPLCKETLPSACTAGCQLCCELVVTLPSFFPFPDGKCSAAFISSQVKRRRGVVSLSGHRLSSQQDSQPQLIGRPTPLPWRSLKSELLAVTAALGVCRHGGGDACSPPATGRL